VILLCGAEDGAAAKTERGAHGYALRIAAETFIFWRPHGTAPHSEAALRSRATAFVAAVNGGTFAALWQPFVASAATRRPCPTDGAPAATTALPLEAIEEEAEARTPPPTDCELGSSERTARGVAEVRDVLQRQLGVGERGSRRVTRHRRRVDVGRQPAPDGVGEYELGLDEGVLGEVDGELSSAGAAAPPLWPSIKAAKAASLLAASVRTLWRNIAIL